MQRTSKNSYRDACALAWRYRGEGMSFTAIAKRLAKTKFRTRLGGQWRPRAAKAAIAAHERALDKAVGVARVAPEPIAEPKPAMEAAAEPVLEQEPDTRPKRRGANLPSPLLGTPDAGPATIGDPVGIGDPVVWAKLPDHLRQAVVDELLKWLSRGGAA